MLNNIEPIHWNLHIDPRLFQEFLKTNILKTPKFKYSCIQVASSASSDTTYNAGRVTSPSDINYYIIIYHPTNIISTYMSYMLVTTQP
jgi:hypothetical protein